MKHLFVPYELALKLKEKGFNEPCFSKYYDSGKLSDSLNYLNHNYIRQINAPLYQQVDDFFRNKNIYIEVYATKNFEPKTYNISVVKIGSNAKLGEYLSYQDHTFNKTGDYYKTFNKAIEEALKLIKE